MRPWLGAVIGASALLLACSNVTEEAPALEYTPVDEHLVALPLGQAAFTLSNGAAGSFPLDDATRRGLASPGHTRLRPGSTVTFTTHTPEGSCLPS